MSRFIVITFISYTEYNRAYQIKTKCNIIEHNIKEMTESKRIQINIAHINSS